MEIYIATLCDSASEYYGKLCILGAFDSIGALKAPVVRQECTLAMRMVFRPEDEGEHHFGVRLIDADGKDVIKPFSPSVKVKVADDAYFVSRNLMLKFPFLEFKAFGQYSIDVSLDGRVLASVPLRVVKMRQARRQADPGAGPGGET